MPLIIIIGSIIVAVLGIWGLVSPHSLPFLSFIVLSLTLLSLIWYTYDTHRIANQNLEANLRPVILRSGFIPNWESIKFTLKGNGLEGKPIMFRILKNIVKDISGHIVINNRKYTLLFGNDISAIKLTSSDPSSVVIGYLPYWSWLAPDTMISAVFKPDEYESVNEENKIYVQYKDLEGNEYFTIENKDFSQTSNRR